MRVLALKKTSIVCAFLAFAMALSSTAYATSPYLKSYGADVFLGGWFFNQASSPNPGTCNTSDTGPDRAPYQDNFYDGGNPLGANVGGILTFAKQNGSGQSAGGASSEYGAFGLGRIDGENAAPSSGNGFYSGGARSPQLVDYLSFVNDNNANSLWGGLFQGTPRQAHCIPDYYGTKQSASQTPISGNDINLSSAMANGQYIVNPSGNAKLNGAQATVGSAPVTLNTDKNISIFVNGNVYIRNNVVYAATNADNIPKFVLVARGNIYIDPRVTRLDGLYIAQPKADTFAAGANDTSDANYNGTAGVIWTCHLDDTRYFFYQDELVRGFSYPDPNEPPNPANGVCNQPLVVNGALAAKRVVYLRTAGDLTGASLNEDRRNASGPNPGANVAEVINYSPEMIMGGPFFNQPLTGSFKVQSLVNLPPVF